MRTVICILSSVAAVAAVQLNYAAPVASGYIYRKDNNGPANIIQLGTVPFPLSQNLEAPYLHQPQILGVNTYQQPNAFAPPLPLGQPLKLKPIEAYDLEPALLPYIASKPIVEESNEDEDDDLGTELSEEYLDGDYVVSVAHDPGFAYKRGAGSKYGVEHHAAQGEKGSKGYNTKNHHAEGESGHYNKGHIEGISKEGEGVKESHFDVADAQGQHFAVEGSHKGGDHGLKKHFSKGEDVTGYHKVFHKDEFKKDHDFYDVVDNSGHFKKHGYESVNHGMEKGGHKEGRYHDAGLETNGFGKAGFLAEENSNAAGESHSAEKERESHYNHANDFVKNGGSAHEKKYAYADEDDDDVNDEDDEDY